MLSGIGRYIKKRRVKRELDRLDQQLEQVPQMSWGALKALGKELRPRRRLYDRILARVDQRLARPTGGDPVARHSSTDWVWRAEPWLAPMTRKSMVRLATGETIGSDTKVFHDCRQSEIALRQIRNSRAEDYAAFGLQFETYDFDGSFLSVAIDLPAEILEKIKLDHIIQLDVSLETEAQVELITRLNIKHGPNVAQIFQEMPLGPEGAASGATVEFDLAYAKVDERRIEKFWVDLIFGSVTMNQISLRDVSVSRRLRSNL